MAKELLEEGKSKHQADDYVGAKACAEQVVRLEPQNVEALSLLGMARAYLGEIPGAAEAFEEANRLEPDVAWRQGNLGALYLNHLRDYAAAARCYREALRLMPQNEDYQRSLAEAEASKADTSQRQHFLISGRFNDKVKMDYMHKVKSILDTFGVKTFMVDAGEAGGTFGDKTAVGLYRAKALIAFCTDDYGQKTGAGYETYTELRYSHQNDLRIIPVQLAEVFPPKPKGDLEGTAQNDFVLRRDLLRIVDIGMKEPDMVAAKIRKVWEEMAG